MEGTTETRVRMGIKQTAKGTIQLDLTPEAGGVDEAAKLLSESVQKIVEVAHESGLTMAHEA